MTKHPILTLGWVLLLGGGLGYLVGIAGAILRVSRLYSPFLPGSRLLRGGTALWAATKLWYLLVAAIIGAVIVLGVR